MKRETHKVELEVAFYVGTQDAELRVWVNPREELNPDVDDFEVVAGHQVNIGGSRRALFELGRYLIALSKYQTSDAGYHDHFDELTAIDDDATVDLIVHGPTRFAFDTDKEPIT